MPTIGLLQPHPPQTYRDVPIIIGGIEASLRRLAHYDYWSDRLKRSILLDSQADLLLYGMGERAIVEVADAHEQRAGHPTISRFVDGTVYRTRDGSGRAGRHRRCRPMTTLQSRPDAATPRALPCSTATPIRSPARCLIEPYATASSWCRTRRSRRFPRRRWTTSTLCRTHGHLSPDATRKAGGVPAIAEVQLQPRLATAAASAACSFCALTFHQGRIVQTRSHESLLCARPSAHDAAARISRATSTTSAARRPISASLPAKSS